MKNKIATAAMLIFAVMGTSVVAGQFDEKVKITSNTTPLGQMVIKAAKVPDASVIGVPAYPGALIFQTREFGQMKSNGRPYLPYVKLLSADPVDKVIEWYKKELPDYFFEKKGFLGMYSYRFWKVKGDYGMLDMDAMGMNENIIVTDGKQHADDYPDAVSMIEITYESK
jgi:hypothetical protein